MSSKNPPNKWEDPRNTPVFLQMFRSHQEWIKNKATRKQLEELIKRSRIFADKNYTLRFEAAQGDSAGEYRAYIAYMSDLTKSGWVDGKITLNLLRFKEGEISEVEMDSAIHSANWWRLEE